VASVKCVVDNCDSPRTCRDWCASHYGKLRYRGKIVVGQRGRPRKPQEIYDTDSPTVLAERLGVSRQRADQLLNREKHHARSTLYVAVKTGKVIRPERCQRCNEIAPLEAHHGDYAKPLDVVWVCTSCHVVIHPHHPDVRGRRLAKWEYALKRDGWRMVKPGVFEKDDARIITQSGAE
jgi:hypothetical protein